MSVEPAVYPSESLYPSEGLYPSAGPEINALCITERPPMRQYILATTPGGRTERWAADESEAANVLDDFTDSDSAPGGCKEFTGALPRKPGIDYSDMKLGTKLEVFGAGGFKVSEYRLERTPRTSGDYLVMDPAASGYQVLLSDHEGARAIPLDSDMTSWGEPSASRRAMEALKAWKLNTNAQVSLLPAGTPNEKGEAQPTAISHAWAAYNNNKATEPDVAESWYDGGGIELGEVLLDFLAVKGMAPGDVNWNNDLHAATDGQALSFETLRDFNATSETHKAFAVGAARYFLILQDAYAAESHTETAIECQWRNVKVRDRSGIPLYGTWPEVGILASDFIAWALTQFAPGIHFTTGPYGTLKPSSFVIPHLVFKDPTTLLEMITQALRFELLEWGVWPGQFGPTFYLNPRGQREGATRWRARVRPAKLTETGQQMDLVYDRVVMSWNDVDGSRKTLGYPGSGYILTDNRCEDTDPQNALVEAGEHRVKHLTMDGPATVNGAAETARLFLEKVKLLDGSGEATLTGYVEDEHGAEWPYYYVQSGHEIEFIDSSIRGYRYIVEAPRSRKSRSVNIKLDAPPDSYAAILAELQVRETAAGLTS